MDDRVHVEDHVGRRFSPCAAGKHQEDKQRQRAMNQLHSQIISVAGTH